MEINDNRIFALANKIIWECFGVKLYSVDSLAKLREDEMFDPGFRKMIWGKIPETDVFNPFIENNRISHLIVLQSVLGFYNLFIFVNDTKRDRHLILYSNPFLSETMSDVYLESIMVSQNITNISPHELRYCYNSLPIVDPLKLCRVISDIFSIDYEEFAHIEPKTIKFSKSDNSININKFYYNQFTSNNSEAFANALEDYLLAIERASESDASYKAELLMKHYYIMKQESYQNFQHFIMELNSFICGRLMSSPIHPHHVLTLFYSLEIKLHMANERKKLLDLVHEMTRKYCLLVRNYSNTNYSYLVRSVINHIITHIDSELTLASLSGLFNKNSSYLSHTFKEETGISLTNFIHQERIKTAVNLINTTDESISNIALHVGIEDFAYFSKIFTKIIGCSPRSYKKMMHGDK